MVKNKEKTPNKSGEYDAVLNLFSGFKIQHSKLAKDKFDFSVELTNPLSNSDRRLITGQLFNVHVVNFNPKGSVSILSSSINDWINSNRPLMLIASENASSFFYCWIDEDFVSFLNAKFRNWISKSDVILSKEVFRVLNKKELPRIESYLLSAKASNLKGIGKITFFEIRNSLKNEIKSFLSLLDTFPNMPSYTDFEKLYEKADNSIYTISIVGPSRTGKSTLINALTGIDISPVDTLPTTGVPFTIQPGKKNESEIEFFNKPNKSGPANSKFLEKYITQKYNPKNKEGVKLVTVFVKNEKLSKGLSYCDVPGLDDPNTEIQRISKIAVFSSNAIVYLIDAAPHKYGGFSITSHHINDLRELAPRMDRLFLVFNKVDVLNSLELKKLKEYVNRILKEYEIDKFLPHEPIYISAKKAFDSRSKKEKKSIKDDISLLEDLFWNHLLENNKTGMHNLGGLLYEFNDLLGKYSNILKSYLIDADKTKNLRRDLIKVRQQLGKLSEFGANDRNELLQWLENYINNSVEERLENLKRELSSISTDYSLPNSVAIKQYLENNAYLILTQVYDEVNYRLDNLYGQLNNYVKSELAQVDLLTDNSYEPLRDKNNIDSIIQPIRDSFAMNINSAINALDKIFSFIGDFVVGIFSAIELIFVGKQRIREKQIEKIMSKARSSYFSVFGRSYTEFAKYINSQYNLMIKQIKDRTEVYIGQINTELNHMGNVPDNINKNKYEDCIKKIEDFQIKTEHIKNQLLQQIGGRK